jgi:L-2-hydroxyglutarate oxidase
MVRFCRDNGVPVEVPGKLIVASTPEEVPRLREIAERGRANGVPAHWLEPAQAREIEPAVVAAAALHVPGTGITDYRAVADVLGRQLIAAGGQVVLDARVRGIAGARVLTGVGDFEAGTVVNCAGLYADRVARLAGIDLPVRIVAFRGEYHTLRRDLVRGLVYPVPDPALPFLGAHLTRMIDGSVHAGPNAVLALSREGYSWRRISPRDLLGVAGYPGAWRLGRRHVGTGLAEVRRSLSRRRFAASLARLVPGITADDLAPAPAGVRAQAVGPDGRLLDDFVLVRRPGQVHVLNAPSPAATSALEIARYVVDGDPAS